MISETSKHHFSRIVPPMKCSITMTKLGYDSSLLLNIVFVIIVIILSCTSLSESIDSEAFTVSKDAGAQFTTVQSAINAVPADGNRVVIYIHQGTYFEKITVPERKVITFIGFGNPVLVYNANHNSSGGTGESSSTKIFGNDFIAHNITFQNAAPPVAQGGQAVALQIAGDRAAFYNCNFRGSQDTLYDHKGRHFFKSCRIEGSVDFIFGNGLSLYEDCIVVSKGAGAITAQSRTSTDERTGFSFLRCNITGIGPTLLGRAWGRASQVVFNLCKINDIISPQGWSNWGDYSRESTVFYGQYQCTGDGAGQAGRVNWSRELTPQEAERFMSHDFIDGDDWL